MSRIFDKQINVEKDRNAGKKRRETERIKKERKREEKEKRKKRKKRERVCVSEEKLTSQGSCQSHA